MVKAHADEFAVMGNFRHEPLGKRVDNGCADAVQTACGLIAAFAGEFSAGVEHGENNLQRILSAGMFSDRHTAAFIFDRTGAVLIERDRNLLSESVQRFVHGIINDLPDQMVKTMGIRGTDIHARTLPYRVKSL